MKKFHFSIKIDDSKEKIWDTMLNDESYREWTSAFTQGSHYKGSWEEGGKILFLDPNGMGMIGKIAENRPYEFVSIELTGFVQNGKEDTESESAKAIAGSHENYTFKGSNGQTDLLEDTETSEEYQAMFEEAWPIALQKLSENL